ncbi:MAG: hypothetical protein HYR60_17750 [Acidobacteria bacterium]|nr:hypothetical protein [Acidobacteriota bacterium]
MGPIRSIAGQVLGGGELSNLVSGVLGSAPAQQTAAIQGFKNSFQGLVTQVTARPAQSPAPLPPPFSLGAGDSRAVVEKSLDQLRKQAPQIQATAKQLVADLKEIEKGGPNAAKALRRLKAGPYRFLDRMVRKARVLIRSEKYQDHLKASELIYKSGRMFELISKLLSRPSDAMRRKRIS